MERASAQRQLLDVINPATGEVFARCPAAGKIELDRAVAAARRAFSSWSALSFEDRTTAIKRMADVLKANADTLAELLTREQGKPVQQSKDEIHRAATLTEGMLKIRFATETIVDDAEKRIELRYVPLGVAGIITPWNAPINLAIGPLVSALYTGNTVVLKPSPYTPLSTLKIGELIAGCAAARRRQRSSPAATQLGQWMTEHPGHRQDLVHGLGCDGQEGDGERRGDAQARDAGARRQRRGHRARRRRSEGRRAQAVLRVRS